HEGTYRVTLLDGKRVDVMPVFQMYKIHVQDYDLDATHQISNTPKDLIVRWARDSGTIKPAAIHNGEGVAHWFHCTANGRGAAMILIVRQHGQVRDRAAHLGRQLQDGDPAGDAVVRGR